MKTDFILIILCIIFLIYCNKFNIEKFILPKNSWRETCNIYDFRNPILWVSCENDRGKYIDTSINVNKCINKNIKNVDGILECE